jgi:hypothetical protein
VNRFARRPRPVAKLAQRVRGSSERTLVTCAATALAVVLQSQVAHADLKLQTQAPAKIEVGQRFSVQFTAMADSSDDSPSQPKLPVPTNFAIQGPSVSTQRQVNMTLGHIDNRTGISATWILASNTVGRFRIGPASVISGGHQVSDKAFIVEIVPAGTISGQRQRPGRRLPFDPFDPFGDFDPFSGPLLPPMRQLGQLGQTLPDQVELNGWPHELDIAAARDPVAFLDARVTPKKVVIGQQISYSVFAYGHAGPFEVGNPNQPSLKDFLNHDLMDGEGNREQPMKIGTEVWYATKIQDRALFPLHAGKLVIEPMRVQFRSAGQMGNAQYDNLQRESQPLTITVVEPPLNGRPAGYRLGDVGQFQLTATVEPREVSAHEAVAVNVTLSGIGNLPQKFDLPELKGVEWLEPTTNESVERKGGKIAGKRSWQYVVKLNEAGLLNLGKLALPYWDPDHGRYEVASADLGQIKVKPSAVTDAVVGAAPAASAADPTADLPLVPRDKLAEAPPAPRYWSDTPHFWQLLFLGPLGVIASIGLKSLASAINTKVTRKRDSVKRRTGTQMATCRQILASGDGPAAASALEKALVLAIEAATSIRARGIGRDELASRLMTAGLPQADADAIVEALNVCDAVRFTGSEPQLLAGAIDRAQPLIDSLCRRSPMKGRGT